MAHRKSYKLFVIKDVVKNQYFNKNRIYDAVPDYPDEERYLNLGLFRGDVSLAQIFKSRGVPNWYLNQSIHGRWFSKLRRPNLQIVEVEVREKDVTN